MTVTGAGCHMISLDLPGSDLKQISGVISWQSCGKPFENARRINVMHNVLLFGQEYCAVVIDGAKVGPS